MIRRLILALAVATALSCWAAGAPAADERATEAEHSAAAATGHGGEGHKKYELLPDPSDAQTWYSAVWVLIIFLVMLAILYPTAWKNVLAGLKAREERIRKDIADAEAARLKADATLRQYNEQLAAAEGRGREILSKATQEGDRLRAKIRAQAL